MIWYLAIPIAVVGIVLVGLALYICLIMNDGL